MKIAGYIVGGMCALFALVLVLVALFFDPNHYKADIERLVQQKTHRVLTLQGDLHLSVFPWLAVQLGPAQLSELEEFVPAGKAQPFIAFETARLSVKLLPLLHGQVEIGNVQLQAPRVRLITDAQGRHNWDDLTAPTDTKQSGNDTSGAVSATVAGIDIQDAEVIVDDQRDQTRMALHKFSLQAKGIGIGKPFDLATAFDLEQNGRIAAQVSIAANVTTDWQAKKHQLRKLDARVAWYGGDAKDTDPKHAMPITLRADALDVNLAQQTLQLSALQLAVGQAQITGNVSGTEIIDAIKLQGHIALAPLNLREALKQLNVSVPPTRDADALKQLSFDSDVTATSNALNLQKIQLKLDDTTARGEFGVVDLKAKALRFALEVDRLDFDRYLPPKDKQPAQPAGDAVAPTPIPVDTLRTVNARGDLRIGAAKFSGLKMSNMHIALAARDGDVRIAPAAAELYGGKYQGEIALNVTGTPKMALTAQVSNVDFAPLLKDMIDVTRISGRGNVNAKVVGTGKDTQAILQTLNGTLDFKANDGAYEGFDLWYEIRRARALWRQQSLPVREGTARTRFTAFQGTGVIHDGVLSNQDLNMAMQYLQVAGAGTVDLVKSTLDYRLNAKVLRVPADNAQAAEMQELVDAEIPVKVTGTLTSPTVRPDIEGLVKAKVKQKIDEEKGKLQEKLQNSLQDKLKDLLGR